MWTAQNIPEGSYQANPIEAGIIKTKNGHVQFAIECALKIPGEGGNVEVVRLTKFNGIESDEGLTYTAQDAEHCGCDINAPIEKWKVNPKITVICKVTRDEYGTKLKSIFKDEPLEAGYLIKKGALDEDEKIEVAGDLNARMAALRAAKNDSKPVSEAAVTAEATAKVAKRGKTPI